MFDEDPAAEGGEEVGVDNARSPAPDAAPEDNPEPDALAGDVDITSGTGAGGDLPDSGVEGTGSGTGEGGKTGEGEAGPASGTTEGDDAVGIV
jgi:hypothetical protein